MEEREHELLALGQHVLLGGLERELAHQTEKRTPLAVPGVPRPRRPPRRGGPPRPDGRHCHTALRPPPPSVVEGCEDGRISQLGSREHARRGDLARRAEQQAEVREAPGHRGRGFDTDPQLEVQLNRGEDVERLGQQFDQGGGPIPPDGAVVRRRARAPPHHHCARRRRYHQALCFLVSPRPDSRRGPGEHVFT